MNVGDQDLETRAGKAIGFLSSTDEEHARAKSELSALQELRKTAKAYAFQSTEGKGAVTARETLAYADPDYVKHLEKIKEAEFAFLHLHNRRKNAELVIELYRTHSANVRRGNV